MLAKSTVAVVTIAATAIASAHPEQGQDTAPPMRTIEYIERYAPSIIPDRIVLTWAEDPKTSQTITWRTSTEVTAGFVEYAAAQHGPGFLTSTERVPAESEPFRTDISTSHTHRATLRNLTPGGTYVYRVGDGTNWTEWYQFTTEPLTTEPFSFVYFGDSQNDVRSMWSRVTREAFRDAPRAAFFLHAGDLVNFARRDGEWGEWFEAGDFINAIIPVVAVPGNHEYAKVEGPDGQERREITPHFSRVFTFPTNGPSGLEDSVFYIDYADVRLICLNSNERQQEQAAWLDSVLSSSDKKWNILTFHHPIFNMAEGRNNEPLRRAWKPIIDRHDVDIVLNGHDHTYGRSDLVMAGEGLPMVNSPETSRNMRDASGTVYVVSVSGPKMYKAKDDLPIDVERRAEDTQLYQVITIDNNELRFEARTALGVLYDAFTIRKAPGRPNELMNQRPDRPEIRR